PAATVHGAPASAHPAGSATREVRVTVINDVNAPAEASVTLEPPQGWSVTPAAQPVKFARADDSQTVRFMVKPAAATAPGEYHMRAVVSSAGRSFDRGYQAIENPHVRRRPIYPEAEITSDVTDTQ